MIKFNNNWRSTEDYFEVSYNTIPSYCPKCVGRNTLDDVSWDIRGDFILLRDEQLLLQNLEKFTITAIGSSPFHTYIGTNLVNLLGQKVLDPNYLSSNIIQEINASIAKFRDLQSQYRQTGRAVTAGELLDKVESVKVTQDASDPTIFRAMIIARAMSGRTVQYSQYLKTN
jgi:hypothetical protein